MSGVSPGWATDLEILRLTGSTVEDRGDHLVVRTPSNPDYHWGHCLYVSDDATVEDPERRLTTFTSTFPGVGWVAVALSRMPRDVAAWSALGLPLEQDEALTTRTPPALTPPPGYQVRALTGADWDRSIAHALAENARTGSYDAAVHRRFTERQVAARRELSDRGLGATFGAFHGDDLVAELGIVRCGTVARYQSVGTAEPHRRRGLAGHLLGEAARWSAARGCDRWVIVTDAGNPAGRVYRAAGFAWAAGTVRAYRASP